MNLKEYIDKHGVKQTALARRAKVCQHTIMRALRGEYLTYKSASKIANATNGEVSVMEILDYCFGTSLVKVINEKYNKKEPSILCVYNHNDECQNQQGVKKTDETQQSEFGIPLES